MTLADVPVPGVDQVGGFVGDQLKDQAKTAASGALDALTTWVVDSLKTVTTMVMNEMTRSTQVKLSDVFTAGSPLWRNVLGLAAFLLLGAVCAAVLQGVLRGEPGPMVRRVAVGLPGAVLATVVVVPLTEKLLEATDQLALELFEPGAAQLAHLGAAGAPLGGGFLGFVLGVFAVVATVGVWIELFARSALLFVVVGVSPIAFAAAVWPSMRHVAHRLVHFVVALIFAKPLIALVFSIGGVVAQSVDDARPADQRVGTFIVGLVIMILAVFAPYGLLRILPLTESAAMAQGAGAVPVAIASGTAAGVGLHGDITRLAGGGPTAGASGAVGAGAADGATTGATTGATAGGPSAGAMSGASGASCTAAAAGPVAAAAAPLAVLAAGAEAGAGGARAGRAAGDSIGGGA